MKIAIERFASDDDSTLGLVRVGGGFACFSLEDQYRAAKVAGETRIPAGTYPVRVRTDPASKVNQHYAKEFPGFHRGMLWLQDVSGFEWIYFHVGNVHQNTEGCILVGRGANATPGSMSIQNSVIAYRAFYEAVIDAAEAGTLEVEIIDRDRKDTP